ncbi:MAG: DUF4097 family beta strand repeat-containing protein [Chitinophagaceae bacterium]
MKKIVFAILIAAPALLHAQFNSFKDPFITKSLSNEKFDKIDVSTSHGNVTVTKVQSSDARVEVYIHGNNGMGDEKLSKEEIQSRLNDFYELEVSVSNHQLTAFAKNKYNDMNWKKALSISFKIYTAEEASTDIKTSHGDIDLDGMTGKQDLSTSHGNIHAEKIKGSVRGGTSHGDVYVSNITEGVDIGTSHGNVSAGNCDGTIHLTTSNGDVKLDHLKGKVNAQTSHGNIDGGSITGEIAAVTSHGDIGLKDLDASVETSTSHGNITLQLPKGKGMNIDLQGKRINVDKLENFSGSKEERSLKGTLNGGGMIVKAETSKGNVNLELK